MEKNVKVAAGNQTGTDISVTVHFEPCQVGDIQSLLTISSDFGGEYVFPLHGTCTHPLKLRVLSSSAQVPVSRFPLKMSFNRPPPSPSRWTTLPSLSRVQRLFYLKKRSTYRLYLTALLRAPEAHVMES